MSGLTHTLTEERMGIEICVIQPGTDNKMNVGLTLRNKHMELEFVYLDGVYPDDAEQLRIAETVIVMIDEKATVFYVIPQNGGIYLADDAL